MRIATVPLVSPRSHIKVGDARKMRVSGPGQNSSMRSWPNAPSDSASADAARTLPTSTGGGMLRPRPLAASSPATACGENASAPSPYTVSVGRTTRPPAWIVVRAAEIPASRCCASAQSYRALMSSPILGPPARWRGPDGSSRKGIPDRWTALGQRSCHEPVPVREVPVVARVPPPGLLAEDPVDGGALLPAVLHRDKSARPEQLPGEPLDGPHSVQPVGAAPQRRRRVVLPHLGRHLRAYRDV